MKDRISSLGPDELLAVAEGEGLDDRQAIEILRNPHCSAEIAQHVAAHPELLGSDRIRRLVCSIRGMPMPRVADLLATLPWLGLLQLSQDPKTPPMVRKTAERKLLLKLPKLTVGEKIGLARRTPRSFYRPLAATSEDQVIVALLENPRLTENDLVDLLNSGTTSPGIFSAVLRSPRWAPRRGVRMAMARNPLTPLPVALSAMAELRPSELKDLCDGPKLPQGVQKGALRLLKKRSNILEETVL